MSISRASLCVAVSLLVACGDSDLPTAPPLPGPQFVIVDGAHNDGNPHVFFLPPLVSAPNPLGIFDPDLTPRIEICPSDLSACTGAPFLTMVSGVGDDGVRLVEEDELYEANWHTKDWALDEDGYYRIRVLQGSLMLAIADVQITGNGTGRNVRSGEFFALKDGTTLPIKVRIEVGAAAYAPAEAGSEDGKAAIEIPAGAVDDYVEITVTPVDPGDPPEPLPPPTSGTALPGTIYNFDTGNGELEFNEPVELALAIPTTLPVGVSPTGLRVYFAGPDGWELLPGEVDLANGVVLGATTHLSSFAILPSEVATCDGSGFGTLEEALAAVGPEGTITVCDGTHTVQWVSVDKPVTIEGEGGVRPTLTTAGETRAVTLNGGGSITLRNLRIEGDNPEWSTPVLIGALHDQVLIEDVHFDGSPARRSITVYQSLNPGARTAVDNVTVTGGQEGVWIWANPGKNSAIDVLNSTFTGQSWNSVQYNRGASGLVQGNTLSACGTRACIRVTHSSGFDTQVEPMRVIGNTITGTAAGETTNGIEVNAGYGQTYEIRDNVIGGVTPAGDRNDPAVYSFQGNGIEVNNANAAGVISGNQISSARHGVTVLGGSVQATGLNNVVDAVQIGVRVSAGGMLSIQSSDFTDYLIPIGTEGLGEAWYFDTGDLTCNWWGDTGGPAGVDPGITGDAYWPWALGPIAGSSASECALEVRVAASDNGSGLPHVGTLEEATAVIAPGGRIYVSDGTHSAEGIIVDRPMTIEAEAGASPVVQTSGEGSAFFVDGYSSGTVWIDGLTFEFSTPTPTPEGSTTYAIRARGTYDRLIVRNSTFNIDPVSRGAIVVTASAAAAPGVIVENTTIDGGVFGIAAIDTHLEVRNSHFAGTAWYGMSFSRSSGRVEGSTFEECGSIYCVRVVNSSSVEVVSNYFTGSGLTGDPVPDLNALVVFSWGSTGLISDNDFDGCGHYQCIGVFSEGTDVTTRGNRLTFVPGEPYHQHNAMIRYENDPTGLVEGNQITGCFFHCIQATLRASITVRENHITIPDGQTAGFGIHGWGGDLQDPADRPHLVVEGNTVEALGAIADPSDFNAYPLIAGLEFWNATGAISGNQFSGVRMGIESTQGSDVQGGTDNTITSVFTGLVASLNGRMTIQFSDILGYQTSFVDDGGVSDLRCNYWDAATGPVDPPGLPAVFTPWATASIANTDHSGCSL